MLVALIVTVLVSSALGESRSPLTIYSTSQRNIGQNYQQHLHQYGQAAAVATPWGYPAVVPGIAHAPGSLVYEYVPTLHDIYDRPFVLISKSQSGNKQVQACLVKDGLISLGENQCARQVQQALQAGKQKKAFLFHPRNFDIRRLYPAKNMTVTKFEIPQNINLKNLVNLLGSGMPYLLVQDAEAFNHTVRTWGLVKIAEVDASLRPVKVYNYPAAAAYRLGKMKPGESSEESNESSSEESSERPHYLYHKSTSTSTSTTEGSSEESSEHSKYPWQTSSTTRRYTYSSVI